MGWRETFIAAAKKTLDPRPEAKAEETKEPENPPEWTKKISKAVERNQEQEAEYFKQAGHVVKALEKVGPVHSGAVLAGAPGASMAFLYDQWLKAMQDKYDRIRESEYRAPRAAATAEVWGENQDQEY